MTFLYPVILNTALDSIPDLRKIIHIAQKIKQQIQKETSLTAFDFDGFIE